MKSSNISKYKLTKKHKGGASVRPSAIPSARPSASASASANSAYTQDDVEKFCVMIVKRYTPGHGRENVPIKQLDPAGKFFENVSYDITIIPKWTRMINEGYNNRGHNSKENNNENDSRDNFPIRVRS